MINPYTKRRGTRLSLLTLSLILTACGGGGGGGGGAPASLSGRVIDGYIGGAIVCVDEQPNWQCDPNEISTTTNIDGSYTLSYSGSLDGKQILAVVPVGATDSDTGPVSTPFNLVSPAENAKAITPFSTMVAKEMFLNDIPAAQAASVVQQSLGLAKSPLDYDYKAEGSDRDLQVAQAVATTLAETQEAIRKADPSLTAGELFKASTKRVKDVSLAAVVSAADSGALDACKTGCSQAQLAALIGEQIPIVAREILPSGTISGSIKTITAAAKNSEGKKASSFEDLVSRGMVILGIDSGDFIYGAGNDKLRVTGYWNGFTNEVKAEYIGLENGKFSGPGQKVYFGEQRSFGVEAFDPNRVPNRRAITVSPGWYPIFENVDLVHTWPSASGGWERNLYSETTGGEDDVQLIPGSNCVALSQGGSSAASRKACFSEVNVSGRAVDDVLPGLCEDEGRPVSGCDPTAPMPEGSFGYNVGLENTVDNYEIWASGDWDGYPYENQSQGSPTLAKFVAAHLNNPSYKADCRIAFKIEPTSSTTGRFRWAYKENASCNDVNVGGQWNFTESTAYEIKQVSGREVMEVFVPILYRIAEPGDMEGNCKFVFAVVDRPVLKPGAPVGSWDVNDYEIPATPQQGVYNGDFCPKSTVATYEFTGNLDASSQFMSKTAFEFIAGQRGVPTSGVTNP